MASSTLCFMRATLLSPPFCLASVPVSLACRHMCVSNARALSRFVCLPRATFHLFFLYQFRNIGILWLLFLRTHHLFSGESGLTRRDIRRGYKWFVNFKNKATRGTLKINFDEFQVGKEMAIIHLSLLKKVTLPEILLQYSL